MRVKINTKRIYLKISNLFYYYSISFVIILRSTQAARDALIFFFINVYLYLLCTESSVKNCFNNDLKEEDIIWTSESVFSKKPLQCLCISFFFLDYLTTKSWSWKPQAHSVLAESLLGNTTPCLMRSHCIYTGKLKLFKKLF